MGQVASNLEQALILRAGPWPLASGAATKTLPQHPQPHHRIRSGGRSQRCGRQNRPQLSRRLHDLTPCPRHCWPGVGAYIQERVAGECITIGQ